MTKYIPLTQGKFAQVDDDDFERLNQHKWCCNRGYAMRFRGYRLDAVYMHREIANTPDGFETDHINGDRLDNRRENLRVCTTSQNQHNRGMCSNNTSGYKGVYWEKLNQKWRAQIKNKGLLIRLGYFSTPEEAARAYDDAARRLHGEFATTNFQERIKQ